MIKTIVSVTIVVDFSPEIDARKVLVNFSTHVQDPKLKNPGANTPNGAPCTPVLVRQLSPLRLLVSYASALGANRCKSLNLKEAHAMIRKQPNMITSAMDVDDCKMRRSHCISTTNGYGRDSQRS